MEVHGRGEKLTLTDKMGTFADRWWQVAVILFGAFGFLAALPHKYWYSW